MSLSAGRYTLDKNNKPAILSAAIIRSHSYVSLQMNLLLLISDGIESQLPNGTIQHETHTHTMVIEFHGCISICIGHVQPNSALRPTQWTLRRTQRVGSAQLFVHNKSYVTWQCMVCISRVIDNMNMEETVILNINLIQSRACIRVWNKFIAWIASTSTYIYTHSTFVDITWSSLPSSTVAVAWRPDIILFYYVLCEIE